MSDVVVDPAAPEIPGHRFLRKIGRGGFADVYAYEQMRPSRIVAVKVSRAQPGDHESRARFQNEANMMVRAAQHNAIVHIFTEADTADGRQYMTMEFCGAGNLGLRYRSERSLALRTVLPWAIKLAGAVETIHRAGILHRDIKPTNVLFTDLGQPKLSDFGISAPIGSPAEGMSVRWSPPESFAHPPSGDERSDIYSLAATIYAALTGHAPFETPGQKPRDAEIISRTQRDALPRINRTDVPEALYQVLARAMAKRPAERYPSAAVFASDLKRVEDELGFPPTDPEVRDSTGYRSDFLPDEQDDQATRVRGAAVINPDGPSPFTPDTAGHLSAGAALASPPPAGNLPGNSPGGAPPAGTYLDEADQVTRIRGARVLEPDSPQTPAGPHAPAGPQPPPAVRPSAPAVAPTSAPSAPGYPSVAENLHQHPATSPAIAPHAQTQPLQQQLPHPHPQPHPHPHPQPDQQPLPRPEPSQRPKKGLGVIISGVVIILLAAAAAILALTGERPETAPSDGFTETAAPEVPIATVVPRPTGLSGEIVASEVVFTWSNSDPQEGDFYRWSVVKVGEETSLKVATEESATVQLLPQETEVCVQVSLVRADRSASEFATQCVQVN